MSNEVADLINGLLFELVAAFIMIFNIKAVLKEKAAKGVSVIPFTFYTVWGVWSMYYYSLLGQTFSFLAGILVVVTNAIYTAFLVYYRIILPRKSDK